MPVTKKVGSEELVEKRDGFAFFRIYYFTVDLGCSDVGMAEKLADGI